MIEKSKLDELLERGVGNFYDPDGTFRKKIEKKVLGDYKKEIVIKFGIDPTRPDIHLGHAVILRKLRSFQDLGCKVIFLVGDFTAQIGDPSGKSKVRPEVEQKEIEANMKTYLDQVGKILKTQKNVFSWIRNTEWFYTVTDLASKPKEIKLNIESKGKKIEAPINANSFVGKAVYYEATRMQKTALGKKQIVGISLRGLLSTLRSISHAQLIERDMFQERISSGEELTMSEMLYPVLQGVDSVMVDRIYGSCDLEVGGTDQTFNMLMARDVMKINKIEPQAVVSFDLLVGTDGKEKMSKSLDNYIAITDAPEDMYGKIMSVPDRLILPYFQLCTYTPIDTVGEFENDLKKGTNPRDIKMRLAREIVSIYHGEAKAEHAEKNFINTFQKGETPENVQEQVVKKGSTLESVLLALKFVRSKSDFRRLLEEGAIHIQEGEKISDPAFAIEKNIVVRVGKKRFLKISIKEK